MITALVQIKLPQPLSREKAHEIFSSTAPKYREIHGLIRKHYILSMDGEIAGGVYLWHSQENAERIEALRGYQINDDLLTGVRSDAIVMHCLPAYRGQEVTEEVLEGHADTIFQQAENRLHAQKAVLTLLGQR